MLDYPAKALTQNLEQLKSYLFMPVALRHLMANRDAINGELSKIIVAEIPAFTQSSNPEILPDMAIHGPQHTHEILRLLGGDTVGEFGFVREHA
jgi:hypothetical protein